MAKKKATSRKEPAPPKATMPPAICELFKEFVRTSPHLTEVNRAKAIKALADLQA